MVFRKEIPPLAIIPWIEEAGDAHGKVGLLESSRVNVSERMMVPRIIWIHKGGLAF